MLYDNFAMLTKRELLIRIVKLLKEENLVDGVKYIPVEMRPKNKRPIKCCVHKDRYILKHKIISILGFEITDEEIDVIPRLTSHRKHLITRIRKRIFFPWSMRLVVLVCNPSTS